MDDYDPRLNPTILSSLKGKNIKKIACGGNFCLGLGKNSPARSKTPERATKKADVRKNEEIPETQNTHKIDEMDRLSFEVKQTYKSYEEIKRNFENLSERYEIDKRNNEKKVEELTREILKYKHDIERYKSQSELDDREKREMTYCIEEMKKINSNANKEINSYKEELLRLKRGIDENKQFTRVELKKTEERSLLELREIEAQLKKENIRRKQCENELEKANNLIYNYEDTINNCQNEISEISLELQRNIKNSENEKNRASNEIEILRKDINELNRK